MVEFLCFFSILQETEDCRVRSFDKVEKETVVSTLFVSNLRWSGDEGDQGYYTCTCEDPVNNLEASTTFYVEISG